MKEAGDERKKATHGPLSETFIMNSGFLFIVTERS